MSNNILFINTSTEKLQLAVSKDGKVKKYVGGAYAKKHNADILPMIDSLLAKQGLTIREVTSIVVVVGPGSFTGIRIGVTTALAIRRATGANIVAVTSLEVVAKGTECLAYLDCKHGNYYILDRKQSGDSYIAGDTTTLSAYKGKKYAVKDDTLNKLIALGTELVARGAFADDVVPFYLKASSAERPDA